MSASCASRTHASRGSCRAAHDDSCLADTLAAFEVAIDRTLNALGSDAARAGLKVSAASAAQAT